MNRPDDSKTTGLIDRFEGVWSSGVAPNIDEFLTRNLVDISTSARRQIVTELVLRDLEWRWRIATHDVSDSTLSKFVEAGSLPTKPRLEDYRACYPALELLDDIPLELVCGEYRIRRRFGEQVGHAEYVRRFPEHPDLLGALTQIDGETNIDTPIDADDDTRRAQAGRSPVSGQRPESARVIREFGDYEILEEIARGGMGIIYKARQKKANRIVALKMILRGELANAEEVRRFHTEAEAAANLDHPGIVPIYDVGELDGQHYFSMGYVEGQSLKERIGDGHLPSLEAAELMKLIAQSVAYANEQAIIHRDLKPANVLLDKDGRPRVTDFGLAKQLRSDRDLTATGQVMGTPSYMPPEQASGRIQELNQTADVYSLGAVLYEMLTGVPPFRGDSSLETLMKVQNEDPISPRARDNAIAKDLDAICLTCLSKKPNRRYASCHELAADLGRFLDNRPVKARHPNLWERWLKFAKRQPDIASMLGTSLALIVVACLIVAVILTPSALQFGVVGCIAIGTSAGGLIGSWRGQWHGGIVGSLNGAFYGIVFSALAQLIAGVFFAMAILLVLGSASSLDILSTPLVRYSSLSIAGFLGVACGLLGAIVGSEIAGTRRPIRLAVNLAADRSVVGIGDQVELTINVRNKGRETLPSMEIEAHLPDGLCFGTGEGGKAIQCVLSSVGPRQIDQTALELSAISKGRQLIVVAVGTPRVTYAYARTTINVK